MKDRYSLLMEMVHPGLVMRGFMCALLVVGLVVGCQTAPEQQTSTIKGQIIVRPMDRVVKPSQVDVYAIPADTLEEYLARREEEQEEDVDSAATQLGAYIDSIDALISCDRCTGSKRTVSGEVELLKAHIWGLMEYGQPRYFFKDLPSAIDTSKTGPNGYFKLEISKDKKYYILARHIIKNIPGKGMPTGLSNWGIEYHWIKETISGKNEVTVALKDENKGYLYEERYTTIDSGTEKSKTSQIIDATLNDSMYMRIGGTPSEDWKTILRLSVLAPDTLSTGRK